jgi:hypothetical protein
LKAHADIGAKSDEEGEGSSKVSEPHEMRNGKLFGAMMYSRSTKKLRI